MEQPQAHDTQQQLPHKSSVSQQTPGPEVVVIQEGATVKFPGYNGILALCLAVVQMFLGILAFTLGAVEIGLQGGYYYVGHGLWSGILLVVASALTILTAQTKAVCYIVSSLVMSIISALTALVLIGISRAEYAYADELWESWATPMSHRIILHTLMLVTGVTALLISIGISVLNWRATRKRAYFVVSGGANDSQVVQYGGQMLNFSSPNNITQGSLVYTVPLTAPMGPVASCQVDSWIPPPDYSPRDFMSDKDTSSIIQQQDETSI